MHSGQEISSRAWSMAVAATDISGIVTGRILPGSCAQHTACHTCTAILGEQVRTQADPAHLPLPLGCYRKGQRTGRHRQRVPRGCAQLAAVQEYLPQALQCSSGSCQLRD